MSVDLGLKDEGFEEFNIGDQKIVVDLYDVLKYFISLLKDRGGLGELKNEQLIEFIPYITQYLKHAGFTNPSGIHALRFLTAALSKISDLKKNMK